MKKIILVLISFFIFIVGCEKKEETIKIGAILPLSGDNAKYGTWIRDAFEMGRDEINASGGINGKKLEIIYEDDKAQPQIAASAMEKLVTADKVPIIFGSWASSCVLAQAPIANRTKTPMLAEAQSPKIRDAGDYVFRIQPDSRYYLKYLVPYVFNDLKIKTIAILYVNNDYGLDQANVFKQSFEELGGKVTAMEGFNQGATVFRTELSKIQKTNPQGVFIPSYTEGGYILKQAKEVGMKQQFIGSAPFENPDNLKIAGDAAEGVVYPHHFAPDSKDSVVVNFEKKFQSKYNYLPEGYAALAYDGVKIIAYLLNHCETDKECIKNELYKINNFSGVTGPTTFDDHGDVIKNIVIRVVKKNNFATIWTNKIVTTNPRE